MVLCERALHESAKAPKISIKCLVAGGLYCLAGATYRSLREGGVAAGAAEVGNSAFLSRLPCCETLTTSDLATLAAAAQDVVADTADQLHAALNQAREHGAILLVKAGWVRCSILAARSAKIGIVGHEYLALDRCAPANQRGPQGSLERGLSVGGWRLHGHARTAREVATNKRYIARWWDSSSVARSSPCSGCGSPAPGGAS